MSDRLLIALVTPFSWSTPSAVNQHVADLAARLKAQGHMPVLVVSSDAPEDLARVPSLFHRQKGKVIDLLNDYRGGAPADSLLLPAGTWSVLAPEEGIPVIPLGASFPVRLNGAVANLGLPVDVTSRLERLMLGGEFDLVHVHEPLAPSLSFTALREARSPVVGTFHLTPVGVAAYELSQAVLDRFFGRLDRRIVTFPQAREMMTDLYPGEYDVVPCGTPLAAGAGHRPEAKVGSGPDASSAEVDSRQVVPAPARDPRFSLYVYRGDGRRSYRALFRSLVVDFPAEMEHLVVALHRLSTDRWLPRSVPRKIRDRVTLHEFVDPGDLIPLYQAAATVVLPYLGDEWLCATASEATVHGCDIVAPDLALTRDLLQTAADVGVRGALFSPSETGSLRRAFAQLAGEKTPGAVAYPADGDLAMSSVAARVAALYEETLAATSGRAGAGGKTPIAGHSLHFRGIGEVSRRKRRRRKAASVVKPDWINADLHVHSNYSKDCASAVESILETAREVGLGAIAIADHNEIDGALLARELSGGDPFVIVAEEVKTAQGEVIGLFIEERIPKGLSFDETLSLIKEQGGLVYIPHPFDALRTTPSYRAMVDNLHRIDVIEIYNAKVALSSFNLAAERFAAKYNILAGAGSDSHVLQSLGTAMLRMPAFHDADSFVSALWEADIIARRKNLLYLQSLKLLQTTLDRVLPDE